MNNIAIAKETKKIICDGEYLLDGQVITLPLSDCANVKVYSPEAGDCLLREHTKVEEKRLYNISITAEDSFQAAKKYENPLVMNFANAHNPGGGFELGANAQEEALCRCSTLYASISSNDAKEMYRYNNSHISDVESDYMLLSSVCVFRNEKCELIADPFIAGVITVPAPNRMGMAALTSEKKIGQVMMKRIRIMLLIAKENGYKSLVLGAWGCGAFHNKPENVAGYFKQVLVEEGYAQYFNEICFAIYGKEDGRNITAFRECFLG